MNSTRCSAERPAAISTCDVAIIGSGPAGASAARIAAGAGLNTIIIEKAKIPRYKTCGGGILARALRILGESNIPIAERVCTAAEFNLSEDLYFKSDEHAPVVFMTMRDRFDEWLTHHALQAGASLLHASVNSVLHNDDRVTLMTSSGLVVAKYVVIADGASGQTAKRVGWPDHRTMVPALECEVSVSASDFDRFKTSARFDFHAIEKGYGWVFPKNSHLSIGVLTLNPANANLNQAFDRYLVQLGIAAPLAAHRHGYVIPIGVRDKTFARNRFLLTGDAAGFADPVTAEGITLAILSGQLAGRSIVAHFQNPRAVPESYNTAVEHHILPELRWARRLAKILYGPASLRNKLFQWQGERLSRAMVDVVTGRTTYTQLLTDPNNYLRLFSR